MATILMVDDDTDLVAALKTLLENKGHRFYAAANGELGLRRVKETDPDLIILDVMMDRYTEGFHVAQVLRDTSDESRIRRLPKRPDPGADRGSPHDTLQVRPQRRFAAGGRVSRKAGDRRSPDGHG